MEVPAACRSYCCGYINVAPVNPIDRRQHFAHLHRYICGQFVGEDEHVSSNS